MSRMNAEARMCQEPAENKAIIVGISGCSSSGKTTLSRLLRDIFPGSFILHEDDFYKPDQELVIFCFYYLSHFLMSFFPLLFPMRKSSCLKISPVVFLGGEGFLSQYSRHQRSTRLGLC